MKNEALIGQLSEVEIEALKQKNKDGIYAVKSKGHIGYFKNPNRHEMNAAMSKVTSEAPLDMYEELMGSTFIGGSRELIDNDAMFYGAVQQVKVKLEGEKAELVNL